MTHEVKVAAVADQVKTCMRGRRAGEFFSLDKGGESHFVPNPNDPRHRDRKIDVRALAGILELDVERRRCVAEPGVTFRDLVRATLAHGLVPKLVPELEGITLGGAVAGCSIESTSFRHGGFHDGCLEYELVTGTGEVLSCARGQDLFERLHGSYGTLGILTKLTFELVTAKPFVHMEYRAFVDFDAFHRELAEHCRSGSADFIDAIVHAPGELRLCLGRFVEDAPWTSSYRGTRVFYRSTAQRPEDFLGTFDYLFRYDTDCHWATRAIPGMQTPLGRALLGRTFLGSTNLLRWSRWLRPLLKFQRRPPVVTDLLLPRERFQEFFAWYEREIAYYPVWIVPYRAPMPYPWLRERFRAEEYVDVAIYGLPNDRRGVDLSKLLEQRTEELGGVKTLISENHYDEKTFWDIYDREGYQRVKHLTDPHALFRDVYEKMRFGRGTPLPAAQTESFEGGRRPVHFSRWLFSPPRI